jgi:hypothetical protein
LQHGARLIHAGESEFDLALDHLVPAGYSFVTGTKFS